MTLSFNNQIIVRLWAKRKANSQSQKDEQEEGDFFEWEVCLCVEENLLQKFVFDKVKKFLREKKNEKIVP